MRKLSKILAFSSLLFLTACGNEGDVNKDVGSDSENSIANIEEQDAEEVKSEEVDWKDATGDIDFSGDNFDDIPWEDIHLSKAQFDDFLDEMEKSPIEVNEDDVSEVDLEVFNIDFDGKTIEYTVSSVDEDDFVTEFSRAMYIFMLDGFTRQYYLQSDYSNGEDQPNIIFYDEGGSIITENNDFIEMGIDEE